MCDAILTVNASVTDWSGLDESTKRESDRHRFSGHRQASETETAISSMDRRFHLAVLILTPLFYGRPLSGVSAGMSIVF